MSVRRKNAKAGIPQDLDKLLSFKQVKVIIPRIQILKLFYKPQGLTKSKRIKLRCKIREIGKSILKLEHARSVVERVLEK